MLTPLNTAHRRPARHACAWLLAALWLSLAPSTAQAVTCTSAQPGDWSTAATWSGCTGGNGTSANTPGSNDTAIIQGTHTVTVTGTQAAAAVTIEAPASNATTTLDVASGTLNVAGGVAINGGTGNRKAALNIGTGTLVVGTNLTPTTPAAGNAVVTFTGAGALNIGGHFSNSATYTAGTGTVTFNGSVAQDVGTYNYYNLTINKSAGTATLTGNVTIGNNLTLTSGTLNLVTYTADRGTAGGTLTLAGGTTLRIASAFFPANYTPPETIASDSTVEYTGSANINVPAKAYGNLTLSGSANRNLPALTIAGNLTTSGTVAASAGGSLIINGTGPANGISIGSGTSFDASTYSHTLKGNLSNSGTFTRGTSTFTFSGAVAQNISNAATFHHLVINSTGGVTPGAALSISGNLTNTAGLVATGTTVTFNGTAAQNLTGATTFGGLTMNNAAGLTLNDDVTSGVLTFTSGKITTGTGTTPPTPYPKTLTTTTTCATSVIGAAQTTGWVIGNLKKSIPAGAPTCTFEVGDSNYYSQIVVVFAPETTAGNMTGAAMPHSPNGHPDISGTDINPARNVNRFWTLKDSTAVFTSYNATFNFNTADIDAGADQLEFVIRRYNPPYPSTLPPSAWSNVTVDEASITGTSIKGTGINGTGDFAIGNSTISAFLREREWVYQRELFYQ